MGGPALAATYEGISLAVELRERRLTRELAALQVSEYCGCAAIAKDTVFDAASNSFVKRWVFPCTSREATRAVISVRLCFTSMLAWLVAIRLAVSLMWYISNESALNQRKPAATAPQKNFI